MKITNLVCRTNSILRVQGPRNYNEYHFGIYKVDGDEEQMIYKGQAQNTPQILEIIHARDVEGKLDKMYPEGWKMTFEL